MSGRLSPLIEKPVPVKFACEMVIVDVLVLVKVSDKFPKLPACTLVNAKLAGLGESVP